MLAILLDPPIQLGGQSVPYAEPIMERSHFPDKRHGLTRKFNCGLDVYLTVNAMPDGQPDELFVKLGKQGTTVSGLIQAWAVTVSTALQHGVPWSSLREKYIWTRFEPNTSEYTSLVDAIAKNIDEMMQQLRDQVDEQTGQLHLFSDDATNTD